MAEAIRGSGQGLVQVLRTQVAIIKQGWRALPSAAKLGGAVIIIGFVTGIVGSAIGGSVGHDIKSIAQIIMVAPFAIASVFAFAREVREKMRKKETESLSAEHAVREETVASDREAVHPFGLGRNVRILLALGGALASIAMIASSALLIGQNPDHTALAHDLSDFSTATLMGTGFLFGLSVAWKNRERILESVREILGSGPPTIQAQAQSEERIDQAARLESSKSIYGTV